MRLMAVLNGGTEMAERFAKRREGTDAAGPVNASAAATKLAIRWAFILFCLGVWGAALWFLMK
jgi:hypothetical protein